MAVFIINNKKYDTDKMTLVGHVKKDIESYFFGHKIYNSFDCELYRSKKGNFLLVYENCGLHGRALDKKEAKDLLMRYDYKAYETLYGEIEEA